MSEKDIDQLINEALSKEDQELLDQFHDEPGWIRQAFGLFQGRLGWVMWLTAIVQILSFFGALYALWVMFTAEELMAAVRWGLVGVILVQISTFLRGFMGSHLEANRVLREVRRLDLRLTQQKRREA